MEKHIGPLLWLIAVVCLLLGVALGFGFAPNKTVEVPVEKLVEVPKIVEVEKEVIREVEVEKTVEITDLTSVRDDALNLFLEEEVDEDEDYLVCDGEEYDRDQVQVKRVDDDFNVVVDEDSSEVFFEVKFKYLDKDVEEKCYNRYAVSVFQEEDEDPVIEAELI